MVILTLTITDGICTYILIYVPVIKGIYNKKADSLLEIGFMLGKFGGGAGIRKVV